MTAFTEYFCDGCNPSAQRREEGDELTRGYARLLDDVQPSGWGILPGVGPGKTGHLCDACIAEGRKSNYAPPAPVEKHDNGWPSRSSPFGS